MLLMINCFISNQKTGPIYYPVQIVKKVPIPQSEQKSPRARH
jgi:hypothetical protein